MAAERNAELLRIGRVVAQLRLSKGWNQVDLANRAGIHPSTMSRIETGRHKAEAANFRKVAEALDVEPSLITPVEPNFETQLDRIERKLDRLLGNGDETGDRDGLDLEPLSDFVEDVERGEADADGRPGEEPGRSEEAGPAA
jgi:transcriptional regulator with XRE-family HTH domain